MVKKKSEESSPCFQKYGVPIYGASWVPTKSIFNKDKPSIGDDDKQQQPETTELTQLSLWLVFCGGGGEGRSGIPNSLLLSQFDPISNSLSSNPMARLGTGDDVAYRMAVHPGGEGVICSFSKSCRWFEWDVPENVETHKLELKSSEKILTQLEDVGQQLAMTFNFDGTALAVGSEYGHLRVFKWPNMEVIMDQIVENSAVKCLSFSSDGKFLACLASRGPCRVWDVSSSKIVASLQKESDEVFGFCQFSQTRDNRQILYIAAMQGKGGGIIFWDTTSWKRIGSKKIVRDSITAFTISADGELLAVGTMEGDIYIMNSSMRVQTVIKRAHLGLVTVLMFSEDS
ncbi:Sec12-like protein, partial [Thalictrum thalictroides]